MTIMFNGWKKKLSNIVGFDEESNGHAEPAIPKVLFSAPATLEEANAVIDFLKQKKGDVFLHLQPKMDPKISFYVRNYLKNEIGKHMDGTIFELIPERLYAVYADRRRQVNMRKTEEGFVEVEREGPDDPGVGKIQSSGFSSREE